MHCGGWLSYVEFLHNCPVSGNFKLAQRLSTPVMAVWQGTPLSWCCAELSSGWTSARRQTCSSCSAAATARELCRPPTSPRPTPSAALALVSYLNLSVS
jgi:hypothetical protein